MTAHELARALLALPDVPVTVHGYEGGVNIVTRVREASPLSLNVHDDSTWYYGNHEYWSEYESHPNHEAILAIHIG